MISVITDGKAVIEGQFSLEEASELALLLRSGAIPVTLQEIEFRMVDGKLAMKSWPDKESVEFYTDISRPPALAAAPV